jgi:hypothetical protein
MSQKIIDLSQYRNRLKAQVEEVTDKVHREIISSLADWFTAEADEWQSQTEEYKSAIQSGSGNKTEKEILFDYINHLK